LFNNGTLTDLGSLGGQKAEAYGINGSGIVTGIALRSDGIERAFRWDGAMHDLGSLGTCSGAFAINQGSLIVGYACASGGQRHPVMFRDGRVQDLGTIGGRFGSAYSIDNDGRIVGQAETKNINEMHGFIYDTGRMMDAGTLPGGVSSYLQAIANGTAVGSATDINGEHAVIYRGGALIKLDALIDDSSWSLTIATGINDSGQIVADGLHQGYRRAVILVPE
jgi:probable HAF family extracellular repeat protein